ncbi:hypothetical protein BAUCODRAFT_39885 [Baudoinia panamericana UAMH 10762]|uniref:GP-PDE domain-containing protein n=1 Tax=Baudoinia panamericana (strain UAMH 10762) TaxID=717646 RepID=M2MHZ0_BAUPA|nr:uncharacterized protein BAUCODRAFT_39885 [Baudoinia panamericana UAMH 10762]EMC90878.1 hypothetical protein BAUCODRAFT_39885 [Baudoinia panamericana UAMH 10762]
MGKAPENTIAAFEAARSLGGPGVLCETDLAITSDNQLVLMHDDTVDRTTNGNGLVRNMTWSAISQLDAGSWFSARFAGERVPLLKDALVLGKRLGIRYQIETKIYDQNEHAFSLLKALIDELQCADMIQFSSFDFVQLRAVKEVIPNVPTVMLTHSRLIDTVRVAREARVDAVNIEIDHFPQHHAQGEVQMLHDAGFAVFLYVPPPAKLEKLKAYGEDIQERVTEWVRHGQLDQIISNDVSHMRSIKDEVLRRGNV